jgi:long-chain fatty acid transport protein
MQQLFKKTLLVVSLSMAIAPAAYATNGMAPTGIGQIHKAMGGAAAANPQNTLSMGTNPATASFIDDGYDVGAEIFVPDREVRFEGLEQLGLPIGANGTYDGNHKKAFLVPEGGYKKTLANGLSLGVAVYGNGGMNSDYKPSFPLAPGAGPGNIPAESGINFAQVFISPTISKKINDNHSVGLSVNLVAQQFESKGLIGPGRSGKDTATGIGATIGYLGKISPTAMLGISHRFRTSMGGFDKNAPLFNGATGATFDPATGALLTPGTVTNGQLDVPGATTIGLSFDVTPKTRIAVDVQRIYYSNVKAIHDGFKWDNQDVIKFGVKHQLNNKIALMGGLNYGESVVAPLSAGFNIIAPAVVESHISLGAEIALKKNSSLSIVYVHALDNKVKGPLAPPPATASAELVMHQHSLGIGYSKTF